MVTKASATKQRPFVNNYAFICVDNCLFDLLCLVMQQYLDTSVVTLYLAFNYFENIYVLNKNDLLVVVVSNATAVQ